MKTATKKIEGTVDVLEGKFELTPREGDITSSQDIPASATSPMEMFSMAMAKGATIDQIAQMMTLNERWEANQAEKAFVSAMTAFKAEPIEILKRKRVYFQTTRGPTEYHHAELSDVVDAAIVGMAKHGLSHSWDTVQLPNGLVEVTCVVTHAQGHSKRTALNAAPDNSGNKNGIQQVGSTITYLQRYTLLSALGLATKGMDDDGRSSTAPTKGTVASGSDEARDKIVADLYACADEGTGALMAAWKNMPEKSRALVGVEFGAIKKRAEQVGA